MSRLRPNGLLKTTVYLTKAQYLRLHAEELDLAVTNGAGRPDLSRRIRDVLDRFWEAQDAVSARPQKAFGEKTVRSRRAKT